MSALPPTNTPTLAYMAAILQELRAIRQLLEEQRARPKPGRKAKAEGDAEAEDTANGDVQL